MTLALDNHSIATTLSYSPAEVQHQGVNISDDSIRLLEYEASLVKSSRLLYDIYSYAELPIISLGTIGHCLSLLTLFTSPNMRNTSFLYHKALTIAELIYCLNCFLQKGIDFLYLEGKLQVYANIAAAFYSATISRMVSSSTGYTILYMTLLIANDRFMALHMSNHYRTVNRRKVALIGIAVFVSAAVVVNSWSTALETTVVTKAVPVESQRDEQRTTPIADWPVTTTLSSISTNTMITITAANSSTDSQPSQVNPLTQKKMTIVYKTATRNSPQIFNELRSVKNYYNGVLRIAYPILLAALTVAVIAGFVVQRRRRQKMSTKPNGRQLRRDLNLFYMLMLTVFLAFLQVVPAEWRRIMELRFPFAELKAGVEDETRSLSERKHLMELMILGHVWSKIIANLCTFLNRSLSFYLYFIFNGTFRTEVLKSMRIQKGARQRELNNRRFSNDTSAIVVSPHGSYYNHPTVSVSTSLTAAV